MTEIDRIRGLKLNTQQNDMQIFNTPKEEYQFFETGDLLQGDMLTIQGGDSDWTPDLTKEFNKLGIGNYTWTKLENSDDAIIKSQDNLIDLLRMYEGREAKYNYEAHMSYKPNQKSDVTIYGFGLTKGAMEAIGGKYDPKTKKMSNTPKTQNDAYRQMLQYLNDVVLVQTVTYLTKDTFDKTPESVKAALFDYHFKNGGSLMVELSGLKAAIDDAIADGSAEKWAVVLKKLVWGKSANRPFKEQEDNPGIYRRSLSRVILAAKGLKKGMSAADAAIIDKAVKEVYETSIECSKNNGKAGLTDIEAIYRAYVENTSVPEVSQADGQEKTDENKYKVPSQMRVYSAAVAIIPENAARENGVDSIALRKTVINEIIQLNNIQTDGFDNDGYPKARFLEPGEELILPTSVTIKGNTIALQAPANWEKVNGGVKEVVNEELSEEDTEYVNASNQEETNSDQDDVSNEDEESIRILDLLYSIDSNPTFSNVGKDGNLKCATFKYKVEKGDTIYRLALRYGVEWKTLLADNNMTLKSVLEIGDEIKINKIVYSVRKKDTLTKIATKYGLTVDYIRDVNNLENVNQLTVGQQLEFPGYIYTVKRGDNLTQISKKAGVDIKELGRLNGITYPYTIYPGQKLLILFNNADYNIADANKTTRTDKNGNTITTIKSDNASLASRQYIIPEQDNGKHKASKHVFQPTGSGNLNGKTIIVNAGHGYKASGTIDGGTPGRGGLDDEWILNYDNAQRLINQLNKRGAKVIFLQGYRSLVTKEFAGCGKVDMFISIHANSAPNTRDRTQFLYRWDKRNDNSWGTRSKKFAEIAEKKFDNWIPNHETIKDNEKFYHNGVQDYAQTFVNDERTGILTRAIEKKHVPSIIWEVAYMTSAKGRERLSNSSLMESYASVMADAVEEYFDTYKTAPATSTTSSQSSNGTYVIHTVKKGDTLSSIAKKYGVTVAQIKKLNGLKNDTIKVGQRLKIKKKKG